MAYVTQPRGWNGRSQARAHSEINGVEHKFCIMCETWRVLEEFHTRPGTFDGLYTYCKDCSRNADRERYHRRQKVHGSDWKRRREYFDEYQQSGRRSKVVSTRYRVLRDTVIEGYGGRCITCGFSDSRALHVDHVNGNGSEERKCIGAAPMLRRIIRDGFPSEYQLLCANCNAIKMYENREFPGWNSFSLKQGA